MHDSVIASIVFDAGTTVITASIRNGHIKSMDESGDIMFGENGNEKPAPF